MIGAMGKKDQQDSMNINHYKKQIRSKFDKTGLPFVTLKYAQTLDGKIATRAGDSTWISSLPSRHLAHLLRSVHQAILVGANTIIQDNPQLTVRLVKGKNPLRIVADARLRSPLEAKVFTQRSGPKTILATTSGANKKKIRQFERKGVEILILKKNRAGQIDLKDLLQKLGEKNIRSLLVEGGSEIITSFLGQNLIDRMIVVVAPLIMGKGLSTVRKLRTTKAKELVSFSSLRIYESGKDLILDGLIRKQSTE
jgi:diaminohydroxyphosphoribosylaminopyrimidine deaminase/5-amino-6-(5-phosphoribosylamino)uracil reductase